MEDYYSLIAEAVKESEKKNGWKRSGTAKVSIPGFGKVDVSYEYFELEGYEEPCYNVESSRCGPGGYYGLEAYVFETAVSDHDDIDIDSQELSYAFTEAVIGDNSKDGIISDYFD